MGGLITEFRLLMYIIANVNHFSLLCAIVKSFSNMERPSLQTEVFAEALIPMEGDQDPESHPQFCTSSLQDQLTLFSLSDNRLTIYSEFQFLPIYIARWLQLFHSVEKILNSVWQS